MKNNQQKLKKFIKQIRGISYKPHQVIDEAKEGYIPLLRATNILEGNLDFENVLYVEESLVKEEQLLQMGDILMAASSGSLKAIGKSASFNINGKYTFGAFCKVIRPIKIQADYLAHFFNTSKFRKTIQSQINGANIKNIKNEHIDNLSIFIPDSYRQSKIVNILNLAKNLINKRQSQILALDELIDSYFYETLKNDLRPISLEDLIVSTQNGMSRRGEDENGQIVLKLKNVKNNEVNFDTVNRIYLKEKERETYELNEQDLLVVRVNGNPKYVGRSAVFKGYGEPVFFNDHIIRVAVANVNVEYLSYLLNSNLGISEIQKNIKTSAGQYTISRDGLNKIRLRLPNENLQNEFKRRKDIIDLKKAKLMDSLEELEMLYNSLLQKAFRGELIQ
ncbi:restriction endonuclease subunit S [Fredinandcohnia onubensis]|uniref:restriction endonuclease subunit S n=1 Tax=Fredinandcohnia onubensis TaxID=1571209 RepID=UPI000C0BBB39|nr:restriction endonuclease subunit S [Fredinandcohnia onubensis]